MHRTRITRTRHVTQVQSIADFIRALGGRFIGLDDAVTTTRVGSRQSMVSGGADMGQNVTDKTFCQGVPVIGVSNGATNIIPSDISTYHVGVNSTLSPNGDGSYTFNSLAPANSYIRYSYSSWNAGDVITYTFEFSDASDLTQVVWLESGNGPKIRLNGQIQTNGTWSNVSAQTRTHGNRTLLSITGSSPIGKVLNGLILAVTNAPLGFSVKYWNSTFRAIKSSVQHPAYPTNSAAFATYGTDNTTASPTYGSEGTIVVFANPYAWTGLGTTQANARVFEIGTGVKVQQNASLNQWQAISAATDVTYNNVFNDGLTHMFAYQWDATERAWSLDTGALTTVAGANNPSGTFYLMNGSTAAFPFHGIGTAILFPERKSQAELSQVYNLIKPVLDGVTLK